jgi:hypothetical protein
MIPGRKHNPLSMKFLQPVEEHGSVRFGKNVFPDMDCVFRVYSYDILVKGRMMNLAETKAVRNDWIP